MRRRGRELGAVVALAVAGGLVSLIVGTSGSGAASTATATIPNTPPAIPCPSAGKTSDSTASKSATTTSTTSSAPASNATWSGVFERVSVKLGEDGSVKKTPHQLTRVAVQGHGPVTVRVPMSSSHFRFLRTTGKHPTVSDGVADVSLDPNGSAAQQLDGDFTRPLPVSVKVTFKLNGQPISAHDVKHKSGTVEIDYQLTNTTSKPVTVCFMGFNGKLVKQTVTTPSPIVAYLSLTVPTKATSFHAPGASLAPAKKGVAVSWTTAMFEPLGPTTHTFTVTMDTPKASIPGATLLLETLNPLSLSGTVPAKSAAVVGQASAAASSAAAKVQSDIAALELKASQPRQPRASVDRGGSRRGNSRSAQTPSLSFGTSTSALGGMQSQIGTLGKANRDFIANVNAPTGKLLATTGQSTDGLTRSADSSIDASTASVGRSIDGLGSTMNDSINGFTASTDHALARLVVELRHATDRRSLDEEAAGAGRLESMAIALSQRTGVLRAVVAALATRINDLVTLLPAPVQNALALVRRLDRIKLDVDALGSVAKATPGFVRLAGDLASAQTLASTVSSGLTDIDQRAQDVAAQVQTLQGDVVSLQSKVGALETAAVANVQGTVQGMLMTAVQGLNARVAAAKAAALAATVSAGQNADQSVADAERSAKQSVAAAGASAKRSVAAAHTKAQDGVSSAIRSAQSTVAAAERKVTATLASVKQKADQALAVAKQKAKAGGQATLAAAQASAAQAEAAASSALASANASYARLLTTNEQAVANQLPDGDAAVTEQNGSFLYEISGS